MKIRNMEGRYAILRFDPAGTDGACLGTILAGAAGGGFFSLTCTKDEVSLVCEEGFAGEFQAIEPGWCLLKVEGPLDFSLTGIISSIAAPLAAAGISIFALSTYDTDYLLVKDALREAAAECLAVAGFEIG